MNKGAINALSICWRPTKWCNLKIDEVDEIIPIDIIIKTDKQIISNPHQNSIVVVGAVQCAVGSVRGRRP